MEMTNLDSNWPSRILLVLALLISLPVAANDELKTSAWQFLDSRAEILGEANRQIWSYAETSLEENRSSDALIALLESHGFEVEKGVAGMPTAFVASYGSGHPSIGLLAEYDALPGVSQAASPEPSPGPNPEAGHACGHSVFGVGSTGAALAIKELLASGKLSGSVRLYGTPAEETGIGKIYMLRAGYFRDDDVILSWHASDRTRASYGSTKAIVNAKFRFSGIASHASAQPYGGRSALDAVELMSVGVNYMREHIRDDARIHYVITNGGGQPNVVPPEAEVWYYIRADSFNDVVDYFGWVQQIAEGAAAMTQTTLQAVEVQSEMHELIPVRALSEIVHENLVKVGPPDWTEKEREFARGTQLAFSRSTGRDYSNPVALHAGISPLPAALSRPIASTDQADISWFVPTGGLRVASYGLGLPTHSWPVVAATGTSIGDKALVTAAKTLVATAIDLYTDPAKLQAVREDWKQARGEAPWATLIPESQAAPASVR
jgi:aminobenzoyl-glutamate utilization protein B